jgi:hypothetical protein
MASCHIRDCRKNDCSPDLARIRNLSKDIYAEEQSEFGF